MKIMKSIPAALILSITILLASLSSAETRTTTSRGLKKDKFVKRVVTMWWVLFNKPSECQTNPSGDVKCGLSDVMGAAASGINLPEVAIIYGAGGIPNKWGRLRLSSVLYKSSGSLDLGSVDGHYLFGGPPGIYNMTSGSPGYCPASGESTEVHMVLRDHGPPTINKMEQLTRYSDPSCSTEEGGTNLCADIAAVEFPAFTGDGMVTNDVGFFPACPPGCAAEGTCTEAQELIQLSPGMGNEATLMSTGDSLQAIISVQMPKVPVDYFPPMTE